ncbi:MAG: HEPN domain-containing protein [Bacteroidota bacterium]
MIIKDDIRQAIIDYRIEQAKGLIKEIENLINSGSLLFAVNRIYYGMFYMLTALALKNKFETSKHQQLLGWFNKTYIYDEIIERKYGEYIRKAYKNRISGDYDTFIEFKNDEVLEMFEELKDFINTIDNFINTVE